MMASSSSIDMTKVSFSESDKLVGAPNYPLWAFLLEQILREKGLWDVVSPPKSTNGASSSQSGDSSGTPLPPPPDPSIAAAEIQKKKEKIIIIITMTVNRSIFPTVQRMRDDPAKLWVTLQKKFQPMALQRKLDLKTELTDLKMSEGPALEDYLKKLERIRMDLGNVGEEIPDKELIQIILRNLPISWSSFKTSFGVLYGKDETITVTDLEELLQAEELQRKHRAQTEESLIAASHQRRQQPVHINRQYLPTNRGQGRGGRGHGRFNNNNPRQERNTMTCNYCERRGHQEADCLIKQADDEIKGMTMDQLRYLQDHIRNIKNPSSNLAEEECVENNGFDTGEASDNTAALTVEAMLTEYESRSTSPPWVLDSGATAHMSHTREAIFYLSPQSPPTNVD
ncbi:unnamed protein product [Calypogeia fissa]